MFELNIKANNIKDSKRIVAQVDTLLKVISNSKDLFDIHVLNIDNIYNIYSFIQSIDNIPTVISIIYENIVKNNKQISIAHVYFNISYKYSVLCDDVFNLDVKSNNICDLDDALTEYTFIQK